MAAVAMFVGMLWSDPAERVRELCARLMNPEARRDEASVRANLAELKAALREHTQQVRALISSHAKLVEPVETAKPADSSDSTSANEEEHQHSATGRGRSAA